MKTLQNKISPSGGGVSMSSVEGSHANHSAARADAKEVEMTVTSGLRCFEQYGRLSPLSSLARTLMASSVWLSPAKGLRWKAKPLYSTREIDVIERSSSSQSSASVKTSKKRDTMSSRLLFQLVPSARLTVGTGFGLSRNGKASDLMKTPSAMDYNVTAKARPVPGMSGTCAQEILSGYCKVSLLPTPMAVEVTHAGRSVSPWGRTIAKDGTTYAPSLTDVVGRLLPTPQSLDFKAKEEQSPARIGKSSRLNPLFWEEMMGYPLEWTLLPFLTASSEQKQ